jgi:hypothetical protein
MEKQYDLSGYKISVFFDRKLIRISGPTALKQFLSKDLEARSAVLVNAIKTDYVRLFNSDLKISDDSMIIEIWGHVYASYLARAMKDLIRLKLIETAADFILKRSDTIDCGEAGIDENRKLWDAMENFKDVILHFLPKRIKTAD